MSWFQCGTGLTINNSSVVKQQTTHSSAYGAQEVNQGQHEWKIKVINAPSNYIMIGVASDTTQLNNYLWQEGCEFYGWHSSGKSLFHKCTKTNYPNHAQPTFTAGDIITVHLDLDNATIAFSKNGQNLGTAFTNITKTKYRLAVGTYYIGAKLEMISYINLSEEQKEQENKNVNYMKQWTKSVVLQCNILKEEYSNDKIEKLDFEQLKNVSNYFMELENDMKALDIEFKKCREQLLTSQSVLKQYMVLDTKDYKSWTLKQVEIWLYGVDNGRYKEYIPKLIEGFATDKIAAADLPDLDHGDLRQFGVSIFKDRKDLKNVLLQLKASKEGSEGTSLMK